jgi:hypothetical protein
MVYPLKVLKIDTRLIFSLNSDSPYHRPAEFVDFPTQRYVESSTLYIGDTRSRQLTVSLVRESTTLRIIDTESFLFKNSIADSPLR